jgi:hypothetical protein
LTSEDTEGEFKGQFHDLENKLKILNDASPDKNKKE